MRPSLALLPRIALLALLLAPAIPLHAQPISAGYRHTCAIRDDGTVGCWGDGNEGQLGDGFSTDRRTVVSVKDLTDVVNVSAGDSYSCAVRRDGTVACWGLNDQGQLGNGSTSNAATPAEVTGLTNAVRVSAASRHTCVLKNDGTVACWGNGQYGQLGSGSTSNTTTPVDVTGLSSVVRMSTEGYSGCAVRRNGTVACWGYGFDGWTGNGSANASLVPVDVAGLTDVVDVSVGSNFACVLRQSGTVACWGNGARGQIGNGSTDHAETPTDVPGLTDMVGISAGGNHACALKSDGAIFCWGYAEFGQLGSGRAMLTQSTPVQVLGLEDAVSVDAGLEHTCATRANGGAVCWGSGDFGQLGDGQRNQRNFPVTVQFLTVTDVEDEAPGGVPTLEVLTPFPNPARGETTLRFVLPASGTVRAEVFNVLGQRVAVLADGFAPAGPHALTFDAAPLAAGVYVARVQLGGQMRMQPFTVAR